MSGNQYGGYGPAGGYTQGPPQGTGMPPPIPFPGAKPAGRSGCASCLIGCVVAMTVLIFAGGGLMWWGITWARDNIFEKQPMAVQEQPMTDDDMVRMAPALMFLKENNGEHMDLTITPAQAQYLIISALMQSAASTSQNEQNAAPETNLKIPTIAELDKRNWKLMIDFPEDGKIDFAYSAPVSGKSVYFNSTGTIDFEISDGKLSLKLEKATFGKFNVGKQFAEGFNKGIMAQFATDPSIQKLLLHVPEFKIKRGKAHIRLVAPSPEAAAEPPASQ